MNRALVPDRHQKNLFDENAATLPRPTFEASHPELSAAELRFAKKVEGERTNLREAVVTLATNSQFSSQHAMAEDVLVRFDDLEGRQLGEAVEDLHLPVAAFGGKVNRRVIALGKTHREQDTFRKSAGLEFQKAPEHIGRPIRETLRQVREVLRNPASRNQWKREHAGMRALDD